eukprot:15244168-Ditylum_brightwellii.AAC.1
MPGPLHQLLIPGAPYRMPCTVGFPRGQPRTADIQSTSVPLRCSSLIKEPRPIAEPLSLETISGYEYPLSS